jgi:hypothetical protein
LKIGGFKDIEAIVKSHIEAIPVTNALLFPD